jgi:hypothetical protein
LGDPELPAEAKVTVTWPSRAVSTNSRLTLVVAPHVPDCSPVAMRVIPLLRVYVLGIF